MSENNPLTEQDFRKWKNKLEEWKTIKAQSEGRLGSLMDQLKTHGCNNISDAEEKIKSLEKEISELDKSIEKKVSSLRDNFDWDS